MRLQTAVYILRIMLNACYAAVVAVMFTALIAGVAHAYRPFDLTDADVATRHNFEIELGPVEFVSVDSEHSLRAPNLAINFGLATGRELVLEGANHVVLESTPDESRMTLEGLAFAMKQVMRRGSLQDEPGLSIAMEDAILFPERGEKHLGAAASLIASMASKRGSAHFNIEGERLPEGRNAGTAGLIFEASDHFGIAPAIELKVEAVNGGLPEHSVLLGLIYVPGRETEYDVAVRLARSGDERIFEIRAGLTWQVSVHEVLQKVGLESPRRRRH